MQFDIKPINYELDFSLFDEQKEINSAAFNIYLFYLLSHLFHSKRLSRFYLFVFKTHYLNTQCK